MRRERVSVDLGHLKGRDYLILACKYSGWTIVRPLKKRDTKSITDILENSLGFDGKQQTKLGGS